MTQLHRFAPKLDRDQVRDIIARYLDGATQAELAQRYGVTNAAINYQLHKHGVTRDDKPTGAEQADTDDLAHLLAAIVPGPWVDDALCAQVDSEIFFPDKGGSTREAKQVCARCPVADDCLEYALANDEHFGIWGGTSDRDRRRLTGHTRTLVCPECGGPFEVPTSSNSTTYCGAECRRAARRRTIARYETRRRTA